MSTLLKLGLSGFDKKNHVFGQSSANISYKIRFLIVEKILEALDVYAKKIYPPLIALGGGGLHGKSCWLIAYYTLLVCDLEFTTS